MLARWDGGWGEKDFHHICFGTFWVFNHPNRFSLSFLCFFINPLNNKKIHLTSREVKVKVYLFCFLPFCCCSVARSCLFPTPWTGAHQAPLSSTVSPNLLKFMCIESVMLSNHLILSPLLMPSVFPSIRVFSNESALHITWSKYWSFSFSNSPSNEYSELISFTIWIIFKCTVQQCCCVWMLSHVQLFVTPWTSTHQAPLSMEVPRQEYEGELPFLPPGDLRNPGFEPASPTLTGGFFTTEPRGKPKLFLDCCKTDFQNFFFVLQNWNSIPIKQQLQISPPYQPLVTAFLSPWFWLL